MLTIYHTCFDSRLPEILYADLMTNLSEKDQQRISRFRRWEDQQARLIARCLLRRGLIDHGLTVDLSLNFFFNAYGKPSLGGDIEFNISHTDRCVVCALTDDGAIGVDVEQLMDAELSSFKDQMTNSEWSVIDSSNDPRKAFLSFWTRKEAVVKADGRGLNIPLKSVELEQDTAWVEGQKWHLKEIDVAMDHVCHMATTRLISQLSVNHIRMQMLSGEND